MIWQPVGPVRRDQLALSQSVDVGEKTERNDIGGLLAADDLIPNLKVRDSVAVPESATI
jgi:hypothetical protein